MWIKVLIVLCYIELDSSHGSGCNFHHLFGVATFKSCELLMIKQTRDVFPAAKIRKEGFRKVFNVWAESHFSNFEVGRQTFPRSRKCLSVVLKQIQKITGPSKLRNRVFLGKCSKWNLNFQNWSKAFCLGVSEPAKR